MGQQVTALMVGVEVTKTLRDRLLDDDGDDIYSALDWGKRPRDGEDGNCLGFVYAISRGCEANTAIMEESIPLSRLAEAYPKERTRAKRKMYTFARWLKKHHGVDLPDTEIFLTSIEVA